MAGAPRLALPVAVDHHEIASLHAWNVRHRKPPFACLPTEFRRGVSGPSGTPLTRCPRFSATFSVGARADAGVRGCAHALGTSRRRQLTSLDGAGPAGG